MPRPLPPLSELQDYFTYDPASGVLAWAKKAARNTAVGAAAGTIHHSGYIQVRFFGRLYLAHRLIWKIMTGRDPVGVDHIDGKRSNNAWTNLREADQSKNNMNRGGYRNVRKGIYRRKKCGRWVAQIKYGDHTYYLGLHETPEAAHAAYAKAANEVFGDFACEGRFRCNG